MQYSKIHIDSGRYQEIISENFKIRSADPTRPDPTRQNPAKSWPDRTRGSIRPVDNSVMSFEGWRIHGVMVVQLLNLAGTFGHWPLWTEKISYGHKIGYIGNKK